MVGIVAKSHDGHQKLIFGGEAWERTTKRGVCRLLPLVRLTLTISEEEDRGVVGDNIPVAFVGAELDGETTRISGTIVRARLTTNSGESHADGALLASLEDVGHAKVVKGVGGLVETVGTTTLSVNDTLGDTLSVEVREEIYQVEVLEEKGTVLANTLDLVGVRHWDTVAGCVEDILARCIAIIVVVAVDITTRLAVGGVCCC
jgi:hypothetical protein